MSCEGRAGLEACAHHMGRGLSPSCASSCKSGWTCPSIGKASACALTSCSLACGCIASNELLQGLLDLSLSWYLVEPKYWRHASCLKVVMADNPVRQEQLSLVVEHLVAHHYSHKAK